MQFGGLQELTLIDYPGKIAATVFSVGCNFRCYYCHNSELVLPDKIKSQPLIAEESVLEFLKSRVKLLQGLCITGGEPTLQNDLPAFAKAVKDLGFLVKLDTNGTNPAMLRSMVENHLVDYIAMDIKTLPTKYEVVTGMAADIACLKNSIDFIKQSGVEYEFRTTVAPGITEEDVLNIADLITGADNYYLQTFHDNGKCLKDMRYFGHVLSDDELQSLKEKLIDHFAYVAIRD
ncbi:MAG TPA: anaerobic ribonucleoside-triphosphate reductase activating protein [Candidatus Paceibacterota bacterium]|nr:anaerobic ribonucleoside-triphosphate reductase activating protein [Candidatus Paceibacterota bacterium]